MNDKKSEDATLLEKTTGSPITVIATTLIAAFSGTPLTALLPVLAGTLANGRHSRRIEKSIQDISEDLERLKDDVHIMSDSQFKIINEVILTIFQTTEDEKIEYLRNVISNTVSSETQSPHEASLISRLLRDLSSAEVMFIVNNAQYERVSFGNNKPFDNRSLKVAPESTEGLVVNGLVSLGLLIPAEPSGNENILLRFAPVIPKLKFLLNVQKP
jgi:hypothetical protein